MFTEPCCTSCWCGRTEGGREGRHRVPSAWDNARYFRQVWDRVSEGQSINLSTVNESCGWRSVAGGVVHQQQEERERFVRCGPVTSSKSP